MKKLVSLAAAPLALALAALAVAATSVTSHKVSAALTPGPTIPKSKGAANARGSLSGTLLVGTKQARLTWKLSFARLTGQAKAAHIHLGNPGVAGNVIIALCAPCSSGASGTALVSNLVVKELRAGQTYVNVHTKKNPAGEIRGQVKVAR